MSVTTTKCGYAFSDKVVSDSETKSNNYYHPYLGTEMIVGLYYK